MRIVHDNRGASQGHEYEEQLARHRRGDERRLPSRTPAVGDGRFNFVAVVLTPRKILCRAAPR
jgi:hypothetical protein